MNILQCIDIVQYILSYASPLPRYMRISIVWKDASIMQIERYKEYLDNKYPLWLGKNGHIALNEAALNDRWDLFRLIMHYNTAISCDDAMRICNIFHKDLLMDTMYKFYHKRNTHQPIRSWYMWMKGLKGKNAETGMMIKNRFAYATSDMMGYITENMFTYISCAYNTTIKCGNIIFEERSNELILSNINHIRFINHNIIKILKEVHIADMDAKECKFIHPILYDILDKRGLYKKKDVIPVALTPIIPIPTPVIVVTITTTIHDGICEATTKKGIRCKKRASQISNGLNVCYIHL